MRPAFPGPRKKRVQATRLIGTGGNDRPLGRADDRDGFTPQLGIGLLLHGGEKAFMSIWRMTRLSIPKKSRCQPMCVKVISGEGLSVLTIVNFAPTLDTIYLITQSKITFTDFLFAPPPRGTRRVGAGRGSP
jgi:hypothetical protein